MEWTYQRKTHINLKRTDYALKRMIQFTYYLLGGARGQSFHARQRTWPPADEPDNHRAFPSKIPAIISIIESISSCDFCQK